MVPIVSSLPDESEEAASAQGSAPTGVERAAEILGGRRVVMLTGAGVSTDSGIPDYRGEGAPVRNPMTFDQFLSSESFRKRYWAGSHLGWRMFDAARPNTTHLLIAELEAAGVVNGVITQNVDGLHTRAGTRHLVDLHGSMDRVVCLRCGQSYARAGIAQAITDANPGVTEPALVRMAPDGDAAVAEYESFVVPSCTVCGGVLKPDVVFFGEFVPTEKFAEASAMVAAADAMVIAGSSLVVNSGIRLLEQARRRRLPIVIVNRGVTKGDGRATLKIDGGVAETLTALAPALLG
ncbi:Sir2 family NAD-dependent protein deacetylase [Herbiconiux sp. A18JL235]|uniref:protein acetyllysine N-acetyltransferase n=1 Tax=Herbiconiux sp. A18JL235 TaxID=3152363 RepID=A0AB39BCB5_9MICO